MALDVVVFIVLPGDVPTFYSDNGVFPRHALIEAEGPSTCSWSLLMMHGSEEWAYFIVGLNVCSALTFAVGYRSWESNIVFWLTLHSMQKRCHQTMTSFDALHRIFLLYCTLLPTGAALSVDAALEQHHRDTRGLEEEEEPPRRLFSAATVAMFTQMLIVYVFSVSSKVGKEWRGPDFTAVRLALFNRSIGSPVGAWLATFPVVCQYLTRLTMMVEGGVPWLFVAPFAQPHLKSLGLALFIGFHLCLRLTMNLNIVPATNLVILLPFLPGYICNWVEASLHSMLGIGRPRGEGKTQRRRPEKEEPKKVYEGEEGCILASALKLSKRTLRRRKGHVHITDIPKKELDPAEEDESRAIASLFASLWLHFAEWQCAVRGGATLERRLPRGQAGARSGSAWWTSWGRNAFALYCILLSVSWNLANLEVYDIPLPGAMGSYTILPPRAELHATFLGLDQFWGIFAPRPPFVSFFIEIPGKLRDGTVVDVQQSIAGNNDLGIGPVPAPRPLSTPFLYFSYHVKSWKWYEYYETLGAGWSNEHQRQYLVMRRNHFARWICINWNRNNWDVPEKQLMGFAIDLYTMPNEVHNMPPGRLGEKSFTRLWEHHCDSTYEGTPVPLGIKQSDADDPSTSPVHTGERDGREGGDEGQGGLQGRGPGAGHGA